MEALIEFLRKVDEIARKSPKKKKPRPKAGSKTKNPS